MPRTPLRLHVVSATQGSVRGAVRPWLLAFTVGVGVAGALAALYLFSLAGAERLPPGETASDPGRGEAPWVAGEHSSEATADGTSVPALPPVPVTPPGSAKETLAEAVRVLEHLMGRFPENPDAYEVTARFHFWTGETTAAVQAWERCLELDASYAHAYDGLASVAAKRGDHQEAVALYRKALSINSNSPAIRIELAKALIAVEKAEEAITLLQETIESFPGETEAFYQLGTAYLQQREFAKAKQSFETTLAQQPRYAAAQMGLANASLRLGLEDEAQEHRERFEQLRAEEVEQTRAAGLQFDDAQATRQEVARIYVDAGRVYLAGGEPAAAKRLWTRGSLLDPRSLDSRQALAWIHLQQGELQQTLRVLRELAALEPRNLSTRLEIARLSLQVGQIAEAEEMLQAVRRAAPEDAEGHAALAELYLQTGQKSPEALALSQKAVELEPSALHHVLLSGAYERNQRWDEAVDAMAHAVRLEPENDRYREMHRLLKQQADQVSPP